MFTKQGESLQKPFLMENLFRFEKPTLKIAGAL